MRALITQSLLAFLGCVNYRSAAHTASQAHCSAYYSLQQIRACHSKTATHPGLSHASADLRPAREAPLRQYTHTGRSEVSEKPCSSNEVWQIHIGQGAMSSERQSHCFTWGQIPTSPAQPSTGDACMYSIINLPVIAKCHSGWREMESCTHMSSW